MITKYKICISGAQCTGKTTLIDRLRNDGYNCIREPILDIIKYNLPIDKQGTFDTQMTICAINILNLHKNESFISDRGILDCLVYTHYLNENNIIDNNQLNIIKEITKFYINEYDFIFFIRPEFEMISNNFRNMSIKFQKRIDDIFTFYLNYFNIQYIQLKGNVENRLNKIKEVINED